MGGQDEPNGFVRHQRPSQSGESGGLFLFFRETIRSQSREGARERERPREREGKGEKERKRAGLEDERKTRLSCVGREILIERMPDIAQR